MIIEQPPKEATTSAPPAPARKPIPGIPVNAERVEFNRDKTFHNELRKRVDAVFEEKGLRKRDCWQMYVKATILLSGFVATYIALVFFVTTWYVAIPMAALLGVLMAGIGFNLQHDGSHRATSSRSLINTLFAMSLDMIGGSSYYWRFTHVIYHHTYANIDGMDNDIQVGLLGRFTPYQKKYGFHRFQHLYMWALYGLLAPKWQLFDDFREYVAKGKGNHKVPRPTGLDLVEFIGGKLGFFTLAFVIPMMFHPPLVVIGFYFLTAMVLGNILSVVFQLAHCVGEAKFPLPDPETNTMEAAWAEHQIQTTVDFARENTFISWYVGGLNFQVEHHLFPLICHVNYPLIAPVVEQTCKEYGIQYNVFPSFGAGIASHYKWLRRLGKEEPAEFAMT